MKYDFLVQKVRGLPVIESSTLRALGAEPRTLSVQLNRWVRAGKLIQLRRGVYVLPEASGGSPVAPEKIANLLHAPSYVSLERALSYHGMIPESVGLIQSVTTGRPIFIRTALGDFQYRHVKRTWFFGYRQVELAGSGALVATPEKALLDMWYLSRGELSVDRLRELRIQECERLDVEQMERWASEHRLPRLVRAVRRLARISVEEQGEDL